MRALPLIVAGLLTMGSVVAVSTGPVVASGSQFTLSGEDTFSGSSVDPVKWGVYSGTDGSGNVRTPGDCQEGGGELKVLANSAGNCGMSWHVNQVYGAWEVHAKFDPTTSSDYDTTFISWPANDAIWQNAEMDYVEETDPSRQTVDGFVHCVSCSGGQLEAPLFHVDMTVYHTYRLEWTPSTVKYIIDGHAWFTESTFSSNQPHHGTVQTDGAGPRGSSAVVHVNDFKVFTYNPNGTTPVPTPVHRHHRSQVITTGPRKGA